MRPPTGPATGAVAEKSFSILTDRIPLIRFISRTARSKGDDTTEQITYTRQEAEALVNRWSDMILRVAYTWTGSPQDAQDVCQTVLLKMLTHPQRFDEPDRERSFLLRVTINCCKDLKKSAWARKRVSLEAAADAAAALATVASLESRVARVEDGIFNNITGNPYLVSFDSLDGIVLTKGIWNADRKRIEC